MIARTMVVGVELENHPKRLLGDVEPIAAANDSIVHAISVIKPHAGLLRREHKEASRVTDIMAELEQLTEKLRGSARALTLHVRWGNPTEEILHLAVEAHADLIAVGEFRNHSPGRSSVSRQVLEGAACAVLVVAPNREAAEAEGFVPSQPVCHQCERLRKKSEGKTWYCPNHDDPVTRLAKQVKP